MAALPALALLLWRERTTIAAGVGGLAHTDPRWLALAVAGTALMWLAGTIRQLGCVPQSLPLPRTFAVQVAGTFANHVLPSGLGGLAVNLRFLRRQGLSRAAAANALGLNAAAGAATHTVLLAGVLAAAPAAVAQPHPGAAGLPTLGLPGGVGLWLASGAAAIVLVLTAAWLPAVRMRAVDLIVQLRTQLSGFAAVLRTPSRAAQLWLGSLAVPVLHCLVLLAALRSLGSPVPLLAVATAYLAGSAVSAAVPSPGGVGALDVALVGALVAVGVPAVVAVTGVLIYRLVTVWLPLLPGAGMLVLLLRRRVL